MNHQNLDRRSFMALGGCAFVVTAWGPALAFAEEAGSLDVFAQGGPDALDQLPDNPTLGQLQMFAAVEETDLPDPVAMLIEPEVAYEEGAGE